MIPSSRRLFRYCVTPIFLGLTVCHAQITSVNSDRHFIVGARALSFGDSYVADAEAVTGMYYNPASLSFLRTETVAMTFSFEQGEQTDNIFVENVVFPISVNKPWSLGLGLGYSHVGKSKTANMKRELGFRQVAVDAAVSSLISRSFSIGLETSLRYGTTPSVSMGAFFSSIGVFYSPGSGLTYGLVLQGLGWGLDYFPDTGRTVLNRVEVDPSAQAGVAIRLPTLGKRKVLTVMFTGQKMLSNRGVVYKGGFELVPVDLLALRAGYWYGHHSAAAKFGIGLILDSVLFDYAVSPSQQEPQSHQVTLSLVL